MEQGRRKVPVLTLRALLLAPSLMTRGNLTSSTHDGKVALKKVDQKQAWERGEGGVTRVLVVPETRWRGGRGRYLNAGGKGDKKRGTVHYNCIGGRVRIGAIGGGGFE